MHRNWLHCKRIIYHNLVCSCLCHGFPGCGYYCHCRSCHCSAVAADTTHLKKPPLCFFLCVVRYCFLFRWDIRGPTSRVLYFVSYFSVAIFRCTSQVMRSRPTVWLSLVCFIDTTAFCAAPVSICCWPRLSQIHVFPNPLGSMYNGFHTQNLINLYPFSSSSLSSQ